MSDLDPEKREDEIYSMIMRENISFDDSPRKFNAKEKKLKTL